MALCRYVQTLHFDYYYCTFALKKLYMEYPDVKSWLRHCLRLLLLLLPPSLPFPPAAVAGAPGDDAAAR